MNAQEQRKMNSNIKKREALKVQIEKLQARLDKKIAEAQKHGYMKDAVEIFAAYEKEAWFEYTVRVEMNKAKADDNWKAVDAIYMTTSLGDDIALKTKQVERLNGVIGDNEIQEVQPKAKKEVIMVAPVGEHAALEAWLNDYKEMLKDKHSTREIEQMVNHQRDMIISRAAAKVGNIESVEFTRFGANNTFNGIVKGDKGTATIKTIHAGGMVQRLHYRVLVK